MNAQVIIKRRIPIELQEMKKNQPIHGIKCTASDDNYSQLIAEIPGPKSSPYEGAMFRLSIFVGDKFPFCPPTFKFVTPVYHPNIDDSGYICLDVLNMPPNGSYNPAMTIESILLSIQLLLATPNAEDPLNIAAAELYKREPAKYVEKVKELISCGEDNDNEPPINCTVRSRNSNGKT